MEVYNVMIAGVPLIPIVLGLVQYAKEFGLQGAGVRIFSMVVGVLIGGGYMIASNGLPVVFAEGFSIFIYGLGLGLVASGLYDVGDNIVNK